MQPVIVGIDPGTTSAFAVLSFDFEVLKVKSKKNYSLSQLISDIYEVGNPIIAGTDKKHIPKFIKEFSQKTGVIIHKTKYDTKKGEKKSIVRENKFQDLVKNAHETDALASAIYAYNDYKPLINKVYKYVINYHKNNIKNKLFYEVILHQKSIKKAVSDIEAKPEKRKVKIKAIITTQKELTKEQKEILLLRNLVEKLKAEIKELKNVKQKKIDIDKETKKIISFKEKRALVLEKENSRLKQTIVNKEKSIDVLNQFIAKSKNSVLIKKVDNLAKMQFRIDDILLVDNISIVKDNVLKELKEKVKIILYNKGSNKLLADFILIKKNNIKLIETKHFALVKKKDLDIQIKKSIPKKSSDYIQNILDEYKRERQTI